MKILVLSHALIQKAARARWEKLAADYPEHTIRVVVPKYWETFSFDAKVTNEAEDENKGNYQLRAIATSNSYNSSYYLYLKLSHQLKEFKPDIIFPTHESFQTLQTIWCQKLFSPASRLIFFTMDVHPRKVFPHPFTYLGFKNSLVRWIIWLLISSNSDGAMCHYPDIERELRYAGFTKPILIQTQIGVDNDVFKPDIEQREKTRKHLAFENKFVIGYAGRLTSEKGVLDIVDIFHRLPGNVFLLLIGDGVLNQEVKKKAILEGWSDRLYITGHVSLYEVAKYMQAVDCFFIGSHTTETWTDTFPLAVAQAMATALPVIGSSSGAIPYQLNGKGLLFPEGDTSALYDSILSLLTNLSDCNKIGNNLYERAIDNFCVSNMNRKLLDFLKKQILKWENHE